VTAGGGVHVIAPDGQHLGVIPAPRPLITVAFSGPDKKTLYAIANDRRNDDVYAIDVLTTGIKGRAK
jgi:sugar lactone lactonase YvrE